MTYTKRAKMMLLVLMAFLLLFLCGGTYVFSYIANPATNTNMMDTEKPKTHLGTKEDYKSLLTLKTTDYKNLTVAEFNDKLLEWSTQNFNGAYEKIVEKDIMFNQFPEYINEEEQRFLSLTIKASNTENAVQTRSRYGKPLIDPDLSFELLRENMKVDPTVWAQLMYGFSYHLDASKVTVGERDLALEKVISEVQKFWSSANIDSLANMTSEDMQKQLEESMKKYSTEKVKMSFVKNYFMFQTSKMVG